MEHQTAELISIIFNHTCFVFQRLRNLTLPTKEWGPALVKHRRQVDYVNGFVIDPWETGTKKLEKQGLENYGMVYTISTPDIKVQLNNSQTSGYKTPDFNGSLPYLPSPGVDLSKSLASMASQQSVYSNISYESTI